MMTVVVDLVQGVLVGVVMAVPILSLMVMVRRR